MIPNLVACLALDCLCCSLYTDYDHNRLEVIQKAPVGFIWIIVNLHYRAGACFDRLSRKSTQATHYVTHYAQL